MPQSPDAVVREFLGSFGKSIEQDMYAYGHFLADDVQYFSGTSMAVGNKATQALAKRAFEMLGLYSWYAQISFLVAQGEVVMCERMDYQMNDKFEVVLTVPIAGLFCVRGEKIAEWRDYWDVRPLMAYGETHRAKMGMPPLPYGDDLGAGARAVIEAVKRSQAGVGSTE
jgi:limonene-1,2-epoxide hydrolase